MQGRDGGLTIALRQQRSPRRLSDPHFRSLLCLVDVGDGAAVGGYLFRIPRRQPRVIGWMEWVCCSVEWEWIGDDTLRGWPEDREEWERTVLENSSLWIDCRECWIKYTSPFQIKCTTLLQFLFNKKQTISPFCLYSAYSIFILSPLLARNAPDCVLRHHVHHSQWLQPPSGLRWAWGGGGGRTGGPGARGLPGWWAPDHLCLSGHAYPEPGAHCWLLPQGKWHKQRWTTVTLLFIINSFRKSISVYMFNDSSANYIISPMSLFKLLLCFL